MKRTAAFWVAAAMISCAPRPPLIVSDPRPSSAVDALCDSVFPEGRRRYVHAIEASVPGGGRAFLMGVTEAARETRRLHCVMMTLEGLVVFEGVLDSGDLAVRRAIAPFDAPAFAEGLMRDVAMMFLPPEAVERETGTLPSGERVCRRRSDRALTDIAVTSVHEWTLARYENGRLTRTLRVFPGKMTLAALGDRGYDLVLTRIQTERVDPP